jgi:hypothetical protein
VWNTTDGITWNKLLQNAPWDPRYWHTVAFFDNKLWVMAGAVHQTDGNEVWYSVDGVDWHELKNSPFGICHAHSSTVYDNALWLMAGINSNNAWKLVNTLVQAEEPTKVVASLHWFPNPTTGVMHCDQSFTQCEVMDSTGRVLLRQGAGQQVDLSGLATGIYLLRTEVGGGWMTSRVVRE